MNIIVVETILLFPLIAMGLPACWLWATSNNPWFSGFFFFFIGHMIRIRDDGDVEKYICATSGSRL